MAEPFELSLGMMARVGTALRTMPVIRYCVMNCDSQWSVLWSWIASIWTWTSCNAMQLEVLFCTELWAIVFDWVLISFSWRWVDKRKLFCSSNTRTTFHRCCDAATGQLFWLSQVISPTYLITHNTSGIYLYMGFLILTHPQFYHSPLTVLSYNSLSNVVLQYIHHRAPVTKPQRCCMIV